MILSLSPPALQTITSTGEAHYFHLKWPKGLGPSGSRAKWGMTRVCLSHRQRNGAAHSRQGFLQIRASTSAPHHQAPPERSSGTTAQACCAAPAGGSRGPQILSKTPCSPRPPSQWSPVPRAALCYSLRLKMVGLAWAAGRWVISGFLGDGPRGPDWPPLLS